MSRLPSVFLCALVLAACGSKSDGGGGAAPPQPATGAPIAFEVTKVTPGEKGVLDVKAYNFSDKTIAGYGIVMRYADAGGQILKVNVGTPFEKDFDFWSMSGRSYACKPKSWCAFALDDLEIPPGTVKATVLATSVRALKAGGMHFEDADHWHLPGGSTAWPGDAK